MLVTANENYNDFLINFFIAVCEPDEFDCDDNTCININLKCNDENNCRFSNDEGEICKVFIGKILITFLTCFMLSLLITAR